jgi:hypothetical protein
MRVAGTAALEAPPERVLAVLRDPRRFVAALPNVEGLEFEPAEDGSFSARIRPAIALGEVPIDTTWRPRALGAEALHYAMEGSTGEHRVELEATVELRDRDGGAHSCAEWAVEFEVTGTMRSVGQRTIAAIVAAQARQVLEAAAAQA